MRYATVLVEVSDTEAAKRRIEFATTLACRFGAGISGIMGCWPKTPEVEPNETIGMVAEKLEQQRAISRCDIQVTEQRFRSIAQEQLDRVSFIGHLGTATDAIVSQSRTADLIVIGQNGEAEIAGGAADPQRLLQSCGRPVLVLPAEHGSGMLLETVVVAWRDCRETRRAVRDALPILLGAQQVIVVQASESDSLTDVRAGTADVAAYLGEYGVRARPVAFHARGTHSPAQFESFARREGAELVIAGGFCRRRLHDQALPDETARMLTAYSIPCLLSA